MTGRIAVVICFALAGCNAVFGIDPTELAPLTDNPRTLRLNNSSSRIDLIDFPVLVILDEGRIDYSRVAVPSTDLRFHSPSADQDLAFEIERWDPAGSSYLWVRVPRITAGSTDETIEMYFGADAGGTERAHDVWNDYDLVLHGASGSYASSTANGYVGMAEGVTSGPGKIGDAYRFVDDDEPRAIGLPGGLLDGWSTYSLELWLYLDYASSYGYRNGSQYPEPAVVTKVAVAPSNTQSLSLGRLIWEGVDSLFDLQIDEVYEDTSTYSQADLRLQRWTHIVMTFDGSTQWMMRDGDFADVQHFDNLPSGMTSLASSPGPLVIGGGSHAMNGLVDEIRVSRQYRHPDWVQAQYLSMSDRFITYPLPSELL